MSRIAVVTGANQGLGFALAGGLAQRLAPDDVVYLTGRNANRVNDAARRISAPVAEVRTRVLDVRDGAAVAAVADELRSVHGGVDIVFSNSAARLVPDTPWSDLIGAFVDTNNLGTTRVLRAFGPILRPGGRMLVVASDFGTLGNLPETLHGRFDTDGMSLDDIDATMTGLAGRRPRRYGGRRGVAGLDQHPIEGRSGRRGARSRSAAACRGYG